MQPLQTLFHSFLQRNESQKPDVIALQKLLNKGFLTVASERAESNRRQHRWWDFINGETRTALSFGIPTGTPTAPQGLYPFA